MSALQQMWLGAAAGGPALWSWGQNANGRLGLGNTTAYSSPKAVGALTTWTTLNAGVYSSLVIKTDGTLWAWGGNAFGQLGLGNLTNYSSPKQVGALTTWSKVSSGRNFSVAVKTDGTLWSWGRGDYGQLGLGNLTNYSSPKQVGALTAWSKVAAGSNQVSAIKTDGTLWSWGRNQVGELGIGTYGTNYSSPKQVGALTNWAKLAYGYRQIGLAIKTDGTLWAWGEGGTGSLGLGDLLNRSSPVQVGALTTWSTVSKSSHTIATKTDGTLWAWGSGSQGQLGLGNTTRYSSPKQVGALTTWSKASAGASGNTFAITTSGALWSWGYGGVGQLGLGNLTSYSSPKQVGALTNWSTVSAGVTFTLAIQT